MRSPRRHNSSLATLLTRYFGHLCVWALALASCFVLAEIHQERLPIFRVDTNGLTPHEIGAELGRQWKNQFPELEAKLDALLANRLEPIGYIDDTGGQPASATAQYAPGGLSEDHREELDGLASALHLVSRNQLGDGFLSRDELYLLQRLPDLGAYDSGSGFGVYASRSKSGSTLVGRNLDGTPLQERLERALEGITVYRGEDRTLVNIGIAGSLGITTGFNQGGLLLAYLPVTDLPNRGTTESAAEPIAFTIRRMLETYERIDTAGEALSWLVDDNDYSILMADRERVNVLEHAAGKRGQLRDPSSELHPALSWPQEQKIAVVGCFALRAMPSDCSHLREQYRWQRFRFLADLDLRGTAFESRDIVEIMLDQVGSNDAINAPTTYQILAFAPRDAELYLGTKSPTANESINPVMHRYADLIERSSKKGWWTRSIWIVLWLLIAGIAIVTLWVRVRSSTAGTPALDEDA